VRLLSNLVSSLTPEGLSFRIKLEHEPTRKAGKFMAENAENKCAHPACDCPPEKDSKYCGEYCEEAEKSHVMEIGCNCQHAGC